MNLRKETGLAPTDRIRVTADIDEAMRAAVEGGLEEVKKDLKADELTFGSTGTGAISLEKSA